MSPSLLASAVEDLTGYRWTLAGWDQVESDDSGYRVLLGGADGLTVRTPSLIPTVSRSLVIRRLAESAASFVVDHDTTVPRDERTLLGMGTAELSDLKPGTLEMTAELDGLHLRLLGRLPGDEERGDLESLWVTVNGQSDAAHAWAAVVGLLLREPDFWSY